MESLFIWIWIIGLMGAFLAFSLTITVQKLILEPYESSRWRAELLPAGPPYILEGADIAPAK